MLFQKPHFKTTASTCRFRYGIYYYCDIAIISALGKPRNFPIVLFFPKRPLMPLGETFLSSRFLSSQTEAEATEQLAERLGLEVRQLPLQGLPRLLALTCPHLSPHHIGYTAFVVTLHLQPCEGFQQ